MNALVPRATVEQVVADRDEAMRLFAIAHDKIVDARNAELAALQVAKRLSPPGGMVYSDSDEVKKFYRSVVPMPREDYMRVAGRLVDLTGWSFVVNHTDLERLMDKEAKDQLRGQMRYIPAKYRNGELVRGDETEQGMPPLTVDNIVATLERFSEDAELIWRRGIANAFSKLDRRFKSHDGFKVGARIILNNAFSDSGHWSYGSRKQETLMDIERTLTILDEGFVKSSYAGSIGDIDRARSAEGKWGPRQSVVETQYFRCRIFENGNLHLWFTRDDLVVKVNKILAKHYGEVIGDGQQDDDPLKDKKTTPAKRFGFFPTPDAAADKLFHDMPLYRAEGEPPLKILEPSAGTGNLAKRAAERFERETGHGLERRRYYNQADVDCVELQPELAANLRASPLYKRVWCGDFIAMTPDMTGLYDIIIMNPPFDMERDIDHVDHALSFLKDDGELHSIMAAGTMFRETRKATAFRKKIEALGGSFRDLPAGSFAECGTYVNTVILRVRKDGRKYW